MRKLLMKKLALALLAPTVKPTAAVSGVPVLVPVATLAPFRYNTMAAVLCV